MLEQSIHSPFSSEIPSAFVYNDTKTKKIIYSGPYIESIECFARALHYKLQLDYVDTLPKRLELQQQIAAGQYDISLHGLQMRPFKDELLTNATEYSYPIEVVKNCIMVPLAPELPKWMYVLWPLGRYVWTYLFLNIFYVAFLMRYVHWREKITRSYTRNLLHSMAILMYSPNMNMQLNLQQASLRVFIFYSLLYLQGFILSNYHISHMTAFDMKPVFVKPINTLSDIIESKLRIIIPEAWLDNVLYDTEVDIGALKSQFNPINWVDYQKLMANPSRTFGYVITQDAWELFNRQQKVLIQPYFHMTKVCFGETLTAYPLQKNSHLTSVLNNFILYIREAGLWGYWENEAFRSAVHAQYAHVFLDTYPVEPLDLEFFKTGWIVAAVGLPISLLAFGLEQLWYYRSAYRSLLLVRT